MDKWIMNMSCYGMELSSDSDLSEMFGEIGYKIKIRNIYNKKRILSSSSESDSENIEELPDIDLWRSVLWGAENLAPKAFDFDEKGRHTGCLELSAGYQFISERSVTKGVRESFDLEVDQISHFRHTDHCGLLCILNASEMYSWLKVISTYITKFHLVNQMRCCPLLNEDGMDQSSSKANDDQGDSSGSAAIT
ncbi:hypothetical protein HNY73_020496 [Argiope bruennichi]|uniref:Uncharacterized protein n=1 Tax=Argiope bruennichi TaxID=94029 RepID=A0A8T0E8A5_ARGBR|nr:hypothetical protein HNY73_020496 [Argiope bruennichi]